MKHIAWLLLSFIVLIGLAFGLAVPNDRSAVAGAPPAPPGPALVPQRAPERPDASVESTSPRTGFVPPSMDLSYLHAEWPSPAPAALPARWDWRESGKVSPVKEQGSCGACYAFAAVASFESRLLMDGAGLWDFSENNAKACDFYAGGCGGGNAIKMASFFSQKGVVLESCDPYVPANGACKSACPYQKTVLDWRLIASDNVPATDVLKDYIKTYGPVEVSMNAGNGDAWYRELLDYDGSYTLYYPDGPTTNHAVQIVGWDDSLAHAGGNGAWIVKNSWGADWGGAAGYGSERGYFTIAYGSARIGAWAAFCKRVAGLRQERCAPVLR